jgi:hypothetical protein
MIERTKTVTTRGHVMFCEVDERGVPMSSRLSVCPSDIRQLLEGWSDEERAEVLVEFQVDRVTEAEERVAEVERERDEARAECEHQADMANECERLRGLLKTRIDLWRQRCVAIECERDRMRPVVESVGKWRHAWANRESEQTALFMAACSLVEAFDTYRAQQDVTIPDQCGGNDLKGQCVASHDAPERVWCGPTWDEDGKYHNWAAGDWSENKPNKRTIDACKIVQYIRADVADRERDAAVNESRYMLIFRLGYHPACEEVVTENDIHAHVRWCEERAVKGALEGAAERVEALVKVAQNPSGRWLAYVEEGGTWETREAVAVSAVKIRGTLRAAILGIDTDSTGPDAP